MMPRNIVCKLSQTLRFGHLCFYCYVHATTQLRLFPSPPVVCNEATALLFMFDLSRPATLASVRQWYMEARKLNKRAIPFLIGTKFDYFASMQQSHKIEMTKQARKFAKAMKASLIFCSASKSINIAKIFKIVLAKAFRLKCNVPTISKVGDPILEY